MELVFLVFIFAHNIKCPLIAAKSLNSDGVSDDKTAKTAMWTHKTSVFADHWHVVISLSVTSCYFWPSIA